MLSDRLLKVAPGLTVALLIAPVGFGLAATFAPAFGYFPALGGETLSLQPWRMLFGQPGLMQSLLLSVFTGLAATAISLLLAAGFVASWAHTRAFSTLQHLLSPLLSIPHAAAAFALAFMIAPSGFLMRLVSPELTGFVRPPDWLIVNDAMGLAMIAGLVVKELPFLFLVMLAALPQAQPAARMRIAASLGYGRITGFFFGVWPSVYPQIRLAVFAVIAYSCSVVDVAIVLGPTAPPPLAVRLVTWMNDPDLAMRFQASAGAVLQLLVALACIGAWIGSEKLFASWRQAAALSGWRLAGDKFVRALFGISTIAAAISVFAGLALLFLWSFTWRWPFPDAAPLSLTLENWARAWPSLSRPLAITAITALLSSAIAVILTVACLERETRKGDTGGSRALLILYLPLIVPQASFVFGLQLFLLFIGAGTAFSALLLAHFIFVLPYVFLSLSEPWRALDPRFVAVARSLGASRDRALWQVRLQMLLRPLLVAFAIGFAVSVGQYLPTLLIGAGRWPTITTEAVALASGGDRRVIGVYAVVQSMLPFLSFALAALIPALVFSRRSALRAAG